MTVHRNSEVGTLAGPLLPDDKPQGRHGSILASLVLVRGWWSMAKESVHSRLLVMQTSFAASQLEERLPPCLP